jgi:hypothetical protein
MSVNARYVPPDSWTHLAIAARAGVGWTIFVNGVAVKTVSSPDWKIENQGGVSNRRSRNLSTVQRCDR